MRNLKFKIKKNRGLSSTTFTTKSISSRNIYGISLLFKWYHGAKRKSGAGMTLIETLVAIGILSIAISGPLMLSARGLIFAKYAKDQITAFYLAQEAVEIVRNIRDENLKNGRDWLDGLGDCFESDCLVDVWTIGDSQAEVVGWSKGVLPCPATAQGGCPAISILKSGTGSGSDRLLYGHKFNENMLGNNVCDLTEGGNIVCTSNNSTIKTAGSLVRKFRLTQVGYSADQSFDNEVLLEVTVIWKRGAIDKDLIIFESLFNL